MGNVIFISKNCNNNFTGLLRSDAEGGLARGVPCGCGSVLCRLQGGRALWAARSSEGNRRQTEGALSGGWRFGLSFSLTAQAIDEPHQQKNGKGHNDEVDHGVEEHTIVDGRGARGLGFYQ